MPQDEIHGVPHYLGYPTTNTSYENPAGMSPDYLIGGIGFLSGASDQFPHQRMLAKVVKDQIDSSQNPGDNSLQGWWTRSQTDWSAGAGQDFMEPISQENVDRRFSSSAGVDPFTKPGNISLLPVASSVGTISGTATRALLVKAGTAAFMASGNHLLRYDTVSPAVTTATAAGTIAGLVIAGDKLLLSSLGTIQMAPITGTMTLTTAFTVTSTITPQAWWVKNRVLVAVGPKLFESPGTPTTSVNLTTATAKVDMKDDSWVFTGATTTPKSILLSGYGSGGSSIQALTLDTTGALPDLAAPFVVAEFPSNERVTDIESYLGTFVGIASNQGVRVGQVSDGGGVTYGPLLGSPKPPTEINVFSAYDRFLYYPVADAGDGRGGMVQIDLSGVEKDGRVT